MEEITQVKVDVIKPVIIGALVKELEISKNSKHWDTENNYHYCPKNETDWFYYVVM